MNAMQSKQPTANLGNFPVIIKREAMILAELLIKSVQYGQLNDFIAAFLIEISRQFNETASPFKMHIITNDTRDNNSNAVLKGKYEMQLTERHCEAESVLFALMEGAECSGVIH